jgi:uncharacterized protein YcbK (DUF882 family)
MNRKKLSTDFFEDEFWSPDTKTAKMQAEFIYKLQKIRTIVGVPFVITSGYRSPEYNAIKGGASSSMHLIGQAVDIDHTNWDGATKHKFISAASVLGFSIGIYPKHFHIDNRMTTRVLWIELKKKKAKV